MTARTRKRPTVYDLAYREVDPTKHALSLASAAARWDCSRDFLLDRIKDGSLPARKAKGPRGEWRVLIADLDALFPPII